MPQTVEYLHLDDTFLGLILDGLVALANLRRLCLWYYLFCIILSQTMCHRYHPHHIKINYGIVPSQGLDFGRRRLFSEQV